MNYETLLRKRELKVTPQRLGILSLMERYGHIDIEMLYEKMQEHFPAISLATLYKNIHAMMQKGLVTEIKVPNHKSKYEITKEQHAHLLCQKCDEFVDLQCDFETLLKNAGAQSGYALEGINLVFSGLCQQCQKSA